MKGSRGVTIMQEGFQIGDCSISVVERLAIWEATMVAIKKDLYQIIIENASRLVVNVIHGRILYREIL